MNDPDSLEGLWILDQFRIIRPLATGGMGKVYLAEQPMMDRLAAIKIVHTSDSDALSEWRRRFRQEARAASRLTHPNIITVYNFGELADGALFLAMEYIEGFPLSRLDNVPLERAVDLTRQCMEALSFAHSKSVIHRDFKPDNVMVTEVSGRDHIKVLDFGVARILGDQSKTQAGSLLGTPRYMSPEQCRGESASAASDQYAMGLVLYELLTDRRAIRADTLMGYLQQHQQQTPPIPSKATGLSVLKVFDDVVMRMLEKEPSNRFLDLEGVLEALEHAARQISSIDLKPIPQTSPSAPLSAREEPTVHNGPSEAVQTAIVIPKPGDTTAWLAGTGPLLDDVGQEELRQGGFHSRSWSTKNLIDPSEGDDLWLLGLDEADWAASSRDWVQRGLPRSRTLACIDAPLSSHHVADVGGQLENVMLGRRPVDPMAVRAALLWLQRGEAGGIEALVSDRPVQLIQVVSSTRKSAYVDALIEDARAAGLRHRALRALTELAEEMILNAVFHAPVDPQGRHLHAKRLRTSEVTLTPGQEATLRWLFLERHVAVSIRDSFGTLPVDEVLTRVSGAPRQPELEAQQGGSGMGLRIMSQAAQHLIVGICPGNWTEVLALVPHDARTARADSRSVCVLQGLGLQELTAGKRLWLSWHRRRGVVQMQLRGEVDESSDLSGVFATPGVVRLDLSQVTRINSVGIGNWLKAYRERDPLIELTLERCSLAVVSQLNMIPALLEGLTVKSILAPYYCSSCRAESIELIETEELRLAVPPPRRCATCEQSLEFDDIPEESFAFYLED